MGKELERIGKKGASAAKTLLDPAGLVFKDDEPGAPVAAETKTTMPDPDDEAVKAARRRKLAESKRRGGRESSACRIGFP
jgi:hypothetical protein